MTGEYNNGKCVILCAPSGSGKTSIAKFLLQKPELNLEFSVSATTREKRPGEIDGKDYYFLTVEEFKQKIENDEFIEWEEVYEGVYYGTLKSEIERIWKDGKNVLFDVDVEGGISLTKYFGEKALAIFIQPPSIEELKKRLRKRGTENEEKIKQRIEKAAKEMEYSKWFDTIVVNDDLEKAQKEVYLYVKTFLAL
ncbi:MAG TPA: guanylate kinase [Flavobacteriales bacterium]|nr:guanylate kinase [Flavobacteriales bacterium]|tara:strand:- start:83740 stop:84324 length:585 start_codon:yes stop_codon:yes gene_type:complete